MITRCSGATPAELEHVGIAVGQRLHLTIAQPPGIGMQRGPVSPTLAHPGIEKEVGDVEVRRDAIDPVDGEDTITVQPLAAMTWEEARDAAGPGSVAILPVGAIEAHGPHLPLETDVIIAQAMARAGAARLAARGLRVVVLPPLAYTAAAFAQGFAGTLSLRPETVTATVLDIAAQPGSSWIRSAGHRQRASRPGTPRLAGCGRERDSTRRRAGRGISQSRRQAVGPPAGRRVPERRLPRRPVRDLDRAGRAPGAGARGDQGGAAAQSGVALPRHPGRQAELRGGGRRRGPTSGFRPRPPPRKAGRPSTCSARFSTKRCRPSSTPSGRT